MRTLAELISRNRAWAARISADDPGFFGRLAEQQNPEFLWIGCADSRVPANQIVDLLPGQLFVHRNVANVVVHTDLNCLSVVQFAVDVLGVRHIIVCGHYGCGGVEAALGREGGLGLVDNWLRHVQDVAEKHRDRLSRLPSARERVDRLCELNVLEQAVNVCRTSVVQDAWRRGQELSVHAWIYRLEDGRIRDTGFCATALDEVEDLHRKALERGPEPRS